MNSVICLKKQKTREEKKKTTNVKTRRESKHSLSLTELSIEKPIYSFL